MDQIVAGGLTQKMIDALKKEHGPLTLVSLLINGVKEHWWFKNPDMNAMSASAASSSSSSMFDGMKVIFENCLVKGDATAVDDVNKYSSIAPRLNDLVEIHDSEVKNF